MKKVVIDMDSEPSSKIIEEFDEDFTKNVLKRYQADPRWEDVSLDIDGDIILWKEL